MIYSKLANFIHFYAYFCRYLILEVISFSAVVTNSALVAFTGTQVFNKPWAFRVWVFIIMTFGIFGIKYAIALTIPDVPLDVEIQLKRQNFIISKIVDNAVDDDDDFLDEKVGISTEYTIRITDDDPL